MKHIIAVLLENEPGALSRVVGLFSARGYNIESLTVAPTEDPSLSRMTIQTTGSDDVIEQITKHLNRLVEVVKVPDTLTREQMEGARRCAAFMREHLPEHFKEPAEMIMICGYVLVDITLRMLQPPELKAAQGFDKDYIIDRGLFVDPATGAEEWSPVSKTNQVRLIGNSVCPDEAEALGRANASDIIELYRGLAA